VALTFDDGPNGRCTADVLDALADVGAPATFFVLGENVDAGANDEVLARMVREGHTIGLHGYHHEGKMLVAADTLRAELHDASQAVARALQRAGAAGPPSPPRFFRPPFGFLTSATATAANGAGFEVVLWTISVGDWRTEMTAGAVTDRILAEVGPGDVIVLHDGDRTHQRSATACTDRRAAADAVRLLVPRLRERGLTPAPLGKVLGLTGERPAPVAAAAATADASAASRPAPPAR
jgi:peptidoglycan/xylan/chitin deacetylase (PgdA/CDA1 family)